MFHAGYGPPLDLPNTGSMSLQFGQPISLGKYAREHRRAAREAAAGDVAAGEGAAGEVAAGEGAAGEKKSSKEETSTMVNDLAYHIMDTLHSTSVCHGTHLVASILVRFMFIIQKIFITVKSLHILTFFFPLFFSTFFAFFTFLLFFTVFSFFLSFLLFSLVFSCFLLFSLFFSVCFLYQNSLCIVVLVRLILKI